MAIAWLPVAGFDGYEVSTSGEVWSACSGRVLKQFRETRFPHYLYVNLQRDGKSFKRRVHRLVTEAFLGPQPAGLQTRHGPGGAHDNHLGNLSYGTAVQNNSVDKRRDGTLVHGIDSWNAKLTDEIVAEARRRYPGESSYQLAAEFGVSAPAILSAVKGETWAHVPAEVQCHVKPVIVCGTVEGSRRHYNQGEKLCVACRDALKLASRKPVVHGEASGLRQHRREGSVPCAECGVYLQGNPKARYYDAAVRKKAA